MRFAPCVVAFVSVFTSSSAFALSSFPADVPNGAEFRCLTCHERTGGGEGWNPFGQAILVVGGGNPGANPDDQNFGYTGRPDWAAVCDDDSDGDGATNGEELGDPDCSWARGQTNPEPEGGVSNPGDPESVPGAAGDPNNPLPGDGGGISPGGCGEGASAAGLPPVAALMLVFGAFARRRRR